MNDVIKAKSCNDAFLQLAERLLMSPDYIVKPRNIETRELANVVINISDPFDRLVKNEHRKLSLKYLVGELLWYERASNKLNEIEFYSKFWRNISDDGKTSNSSYGNKIYNSTTNDSHNQWIFARNELIKDKNSRRAMLLILAKEDCNLTTKDLPCTVGLQFVIRDEKLNMTVWMRSNDIFLGFCYDVAIFTLWLEKMLIELQKYYPDLQAGSYTHFVSSLHLYENNFNQVEKIVRYPHANNSSPLFDMPKMICTESFRRVQPHEESFRQNKVNIISNEMFTNEFEKWLLDCLCYED